MPTSSKRRIVRLWAGLIVIGHSFGGFTGHHQLRQKKLQVLKAVANLGQRRDKRFLDYGERIPASFEDFRGEVLGLFNITRLKCRAQGGFLLMG